MKDSQFNHDRTIARLYPEGFDGEPRRAVMKSQEAIYRMFCQWCSQVREPVRNTYLQCVKCDKAGPQEPIAARGYR